MRQPWMSLAAAALLAGLSACESNGDGRIDASAPTVTFGYDDQDDYPEIAERAHDYCDDNFDRDAVLVDQEEDGGSYEAVFACK